MTSENQRFLYIKINAFNNFEKIKYFLKTRFFKSEKIPSFYKKCDMYNKFTEIFSAGSLAMLTKNHFDHFFLML